MKASADGSGGVVLRLEVLAELSAVRRVLLSATQRPNFEQYLEQYLKTAYELHAEGKLLADPVEDTEREKEFLQMTHNGTMDRILARDLYRHRNNPLMDGPDQMFREQIKEWRQRLALLSNETWADSNWTGAFGSIKAQVVEEPIVSWDGEDPKSVSIVLGPTSLAVFKDILEYHFQAKGLKKPANTQISPNLLAGSYKPGGCAVQPSGSSANPLQALYNAVLPLAQNLPQTQRPCSPWQPSTQTRAKLRERIKEHLSPGSSSGRSRGRWHH